MIMKQSAVVLATLLLLTQCNGQDTEARSASSPHLRSTYSLSLHPTDQKSREEFTSSASRGLRSILNTSGRQQHDATRGLAGNDASVCMGNIAFYVSAEKAVELNCVQYDSSSLLDRPPCIYGPCPEGYTKLSTVKKEEEESTQRTDKASITHVDLSEDGNTLVVGEVTYNEGAGQVRVLQRSGADWVQVGNPIAIDISRWGDDQIGMDVSLSQYGDRVGLSRYNFENGAKSEGAVEIYEYKSVSNSWVPMGHRIEGGTQYVLLGKHMQLSSDGLTIAYSVPFANQAKGQIHVRKYENGEWVPKGNVIETVIAGMLGNLDLALSDDGSKVLFSVGLDAVDVFEYDETSSLWSRRNPNLSIMISDPTPDTADDGAYFGSAVAMNGDASRVAVAESKTPGMMDTTGEVHIYFWNETAHEYEYENYLRGWHNKSNCGVSVAFDTSGDTFAMGCSKIESASSLGSNGWVFVYEWSGAYYALLDIVKDEGVENREAGTQIALSGQGRILAVSTVLNHEVKTFEYVKS